ncbi:MAG: hypothetical protein QXK89_08625 [Candidatus Bathyarchaeia archaeon]
MQKRKKRKNRSLKELRRKVDSVLLNLELLRNETRLKFYKETLRLERRRVKRGLNKAYIT